MFIEFQVANQSNHGGIYAWARMLDFAMTGNATSFNEANSAGLTYYKLWTNANPGGWTSRSKIGPFNAAGNTWNWSQPVIGKQDIPFFHKGFGLRLNVLSSANNYFQGFMGAFQNPADRNAHAAFDQGRSLNANYTTNTVTTARFDALNSNNRFAFQDRYIVSAAEGYVFIGNVTQCTFWAVVDGTALPIHQFATSSSIPMIGLSGMQPDTGVTNTRHDLTVHVHKYDSGSGASYNTLSSFNQVVSSDSGAAPSTTNFLNLYPSSVSGLSLLDRFDEDGKKSTALYPIIVGNPIRGNAYQTTEGTLLVSGQSHETGQTFYVGPSRYYKFTCTHDRVARNSVFSGLTIGVPVR